MACDDAWMYVSIGVLIPCVVFIPFLCWIMRRHIARESFVKNLAERSLLSATGRNEIQLRQSMQTEDTTVLGTGERPGTSTQMINTLLSNEPGAIQEQKMNATISAVLVASETTTPAESSPRESTVSENFTVAFCSTKRPDEIKLPKKVSSELNLPNLQQPKRELERSSSCSVVAKPHDMQHLKSKSFSLDILHLKPPEVSGKDVSVQITSSSGTRDTCSCLTPDLQDLRLSELLTEVMKPMQVLEHGTHPTETENMWTTFNASLNNNSPKGITKMEVANNMCFLQENPKERQTSENVLKTPVEDVVSIETSSESGTRNRSWQGANAWTRVHDRMESSLNFSSSGIGSKSCRAAPEILTNRCQSLKSTKSNDVDNKHTRVTENQVYATLPANKLRAVSYEPPKYATPSSAVSRAVTEPVEQAVENQALPGSGRISNIIAHEAIDQRLGGITSYEKGALETNRFIGNRVTKNLEEEATGNDTAKSTDTISEITETREVKVGAMRMCCEKKNDSLISDNVRETAVLVDEAYQKYITRLMNECN